MGKTNFSIENRSWKFCETTGEAPPALINDPYSFIYQDNLCIYRVIVQDHYDRSLLSDLFMLDLNSMAWKRIEQQEKYLGDTKRDIGGIGGTIYQDHFVTLRREVDYSKNGNALYVLNLHTKNTWSVFDIKGLNQDSWRYDSLTGCLMTYKNMILGFDATEEKRNLILAMMNMDHFGISAPKSPEQERLSSLFLNRDESDVAFKIEGEIIPSHKKILVRKSKYFAGLFKSGMAETTQNVIEIQDCEYEIFKEYLRWIYQETVNTKDANQAIKLYILADKYLQDDLHEKCVNLLISLINMENVYTILDFARQGNIISLKSWCLKVCHDKITVINVVHLVKYLGSKEEDSESKELRNFALNFVLDNFFEIYDNNKGEIRIYEEFLMKNIEIETISPLVRFLGLECYLSEKEKSSLSQEKSEEENRRRKEILEKSLPQLKEAVFSLVEENAKIIMKSEIAKEFSNSFFRDFVLYTTENLCEAKAKLKRMEPSQKNSFDGEEGHELKKTKKSDLGNGN